MKRRGFRVALALALAVGVCGCRKKAQPPAPPPVPVVAAKAVAKTMPLLVETMGSVEAYNSLEIVPRVSGQILELHFREGDEVDAGALLLSLDPAPYLETLHEAESLLASDVAALEFKRNEAERYARLVEKRAVARSEFDETRTGAAAHEDRIKADRAVVEQARLNVGYCSIASPIRGRAGAYLVNRGAVVEANKTRLLVVNQVKPLYVTFSVPEQHLTAIRAAQQQGALTVEARIPEVEGEVRRGPLTFIDNQVDPSTGMIRLKGTFPNADGFLWPGQFVRVALVLGEEEGAVVVPASAIQAGPEGKLVFVVKPDGTAEIRPVRLSRLVGREAVVAQGLAPGETVVTDGQNKLRNGAAVAFVEPPAPAAPNAVAGPSDPP